MNGNSPSLCVRRRASSPTRALVFLAQPLEHRLKPHAQQANRMQDEEHRHAPAAEPLEHGHALARRDGERDGLRVAVEQVDVARSAGERAGRVDAIADVLYAGRRVARDDAALHLVVETKARESPRSRRERFQPGSTAWPTEVRKTSAAVCSLLRGPSSRSSGSSPTRCARRSSAYDERVDLQHHQSAPSVVRAALAAKDAIF